MRIHCIQNIKKLKWHPPVSFSTIAWQGRRIRTQGLVAGPVQVLGTCTTADMAAADL